MRIYTILNGKFSGEYHIYENEEEFLKYHPNLTYKIWGKNTDIAVGEYVRLLDGYICLCLNVYELKSYKNKYLKTFFFTFPTGSSYLRINREGIPKFQNMHAWYTTDKNNVAVQKKTYDKPKMKFLIEALRSNPTLTILQAVDALGFDNKGNAIYLNKYKFINEAVMNKDVQIALDERYNSFKTKLLNDDEFSDESLLEFIKDFKRHVRKGSMAHLQSIIPMLELADKIKKENPNEKYNKINDSTEIPYEEVLPPQINQ